FRRVVSRHSSECLVRCYRKIIHDHRARTHERNRCAAAQKRANKVYIDHAAKFFGSHPIDVRQGMRRAGVVDQEIESAHSFAYSVEEFTYLIWIGDIAALGGNRKSFSLELRDGRLKGLRIASGNRDAAAVVPKFARDSQSDTAAPSGDDRGLSVQVHLVLISPRSHSVPRKSKNN